MVQGFYKISEATLLLIRRRSLETHAKGIGRFLALLLILIGLPEGIRGDYFLRLSDFESLMRNVFRC